MINSIYSNGNGVALVFFDKQVFKSVDEFRTYLVATHGHTDAACDLICGGLPSISLEDCDLFIKEAIGLYPRRGVSLRKAAASIGLVIDPPTPRTTKKTTKAVTTKKTTKRTTRKTTK